MQIYKKIVRHKRNVKREPQRWLSLMDDDVVGVTKPGSGRGCVGCRYDDGNADFDGGGSAAAKKQQRKHLAKFQIWKIEATATGGTLQFICKQTNKPDNAPVEQATTRRCSTPHPPPPLKSCYNTQRSQAQVSFWLPCFVLTAAGCCMSSISHPLPPPRCSLFSFLLPVRCVSVFSSPFSVDVFVRRTFQSTLEWKLKKIKTGIMWLAMGGGGCVDWYELLLLAVLVVCQREDHAVGGGRKELCLSGNGCATLKWHKLCAICGDVAHHETIHDRTTPHTFR